MDTALERMTRELNEHATLVAAMQPLLAKVEAVGRAICASFGSGAAIRSILGVGPGGDASRARSPPPILSRRARAIRRIAKKARGAEPPPREYPPLRTFRTGSAQIGQLSMNGPIGPYPQLGQRLAMIGPDGWGNGLRCTGQVP